MIVIAAANPNRTSTDAAVGHENEEGTSGCETRLGRGAVIALGTMLFTAVGKVGPPL